MSSIRTQLIEDHRQDANRSGEGAAIELADGSLYMVYGKFTGGRDHSPADLVWRRSTDQGQSWSEPQMFFQRPEGWVNAMSVSLVRLHDGRLAALFLAKLNTDTCVPFWMTSSDEAQSWSEPRRIIGNGGYYVVNNDRLVQLSDGRLLIPYAFSMTCSAVAMPKCGCLISDDQGETWRHGQQELAVQPENYRIPEQLPVDRLPVLRRFTYQLVRAQEPGVVELNNGRVLMWARSNGGYAYATTSTDRGETWAPFKTLCDTPMANGPATIRRLPGMNRLVMLHNDRTGINYGDPTFSWRTPLAVSVSDDEAASWQRHAPLIGDDSVNYCYYSMTFFAQQCLITTYQGVTQQLEDGTTVRENLKSHLAIVVDNQWFC